MGGPSSPSPGEDGGPSRQLALGEQRLSRLGTVALQATWARSVGDLARIVAEQGLPAVGADGGSVLVRDDPAGVVRATFATPLSHDVLTHFGELPIDSPHPGVHAARTGRRVLLPSVADALAFSPVMAVTHGMTGRRAWACVPLRVGDRLLGALAASWDDEHAFDEDDVELLAVFADQCALALDRIQREEAARAEAIEAQQLSEALQRSLLTQPATPEHLQLAVRYQPAAHAAQIGGDWYDAYVTAGGSTMIAIGDVSGHDRAAAAAMGQLRNLARGMSYDSEDSPAVLLRRLDAAIAGLQLGILATAVLGRIEQDAADRLRGCSRLRWSSAGHLPPMLREPDGQVRVLAPAADLMLGVDPRADRSEHLADLADGATALLYTDGLVERRDAPLVDCLRDLSLLFARVGGGPPEEVCDAVLEATRGRTNDDDVAVLVLRVGLRR